MELTDDKADDVYCELVTLFKHMYYKEVYFEEKQLTIEYSIRILMSVALFDDKTISGKEFQTTAIEALLHDNFSWDRLYQETPSYS